VSNSLTSIQGMVISCARLAGKSRLYRRFRAFEPVVPPG